MGLNYMAELNAMRDYLLLRPLASGQISLWHGLMMINNLCGWKSRLFRGCRTVEFIRPGKCLRRGSSSTTCPVRQA